MLFQPFRNSPLSLLPEDEISLVRPLLTRLRLVPGQVLIEQGQVTEHVFFMEDGLVSLISEPTATRSGVQVAMLGHEGIVGGHALAGVSKGAFVSAVTQIPGPALRLPIVEMHRLMLQCPVLKRVSVEANEALLHQIMQTAASNACNTLAERCVRWLLMAHDRVAGNQLAITHAALSNLLGVRRSGISLVAASLQEAGVLRVNRGRITITDRPGLERFAGGTPWTLDGPSVQATRWASATGEGMFSPLARPLTGPALNERKWS